MLAFCSTNNQKTATERGACPAPFPFGYDAQPDAHAKKAHKSVRLSCIRLIFAVCCDIIFLLENNGYLAKSRLYSLVVVQDCGYAAIQSNTPRDGLGPRGLGFESWHSDQSGWNLMISAGFFVLVAKFVTNEDLEQKAPEGKFRRPPEQFRQAAQFLRFFLSILFSWLSIRQTVSLNRIIQ